MTFKTLAAAAALSLLSTALWAHEFKVGNLEIVHPMAFETAPMAMTGVGFMTIINSGTEADRLIAVRADFPKVGIHESVVTDGVNRMLPVEAIELAPGETVSLEPGGRHVMFMGLNGRQFKEGEEFPATLVFERAGELPVTFKIGKPSEGMDMKMQHGDHTTAPSN